MITSTRDLREKLSDCIDRVMSGDMTPLDARAVSSLSSQMLASARLDVQASKTAQQARELPPAHSFMTPATEGTGSNGCVVTAAKPRRAVASKS
jgi:hypothetical protein